MSRVRSSRVRVSRVESREGLWFIILEPSARHLAKAALKQLSYLYLFPPLSLKIVLSHVSEVTVLSIEVILL